MLFRSVDFSVHRIQEGDSVVDAVISACKTRTRPILITALALVCGSSVIFFDPIFQGMAISLASGVLVSTLLTLVVIPLGCVAAADSLCAVAGTKCKKFSKGNEPDGGPGGGPKGGGPRVGDPLWVRAWSGFATVMFTVIGGVVALVDLFGGLLKPKKSANAPPPRAPAHKPKATESTVTPEASSTPVAAPAIDAKEAASDVAPAAGAAARKTPEERPQAPAQKKVAAATDSTQKKVPAKQSVRDRKSVV